LRFFLGLFGESNLVRLAVKPQLIFEPLPALNDMLAEGSLKSSGMSENLMRSSYPVSWG
jgi:hypothetical protein